MLPILKKFNNTDGLLFFFLLCLILVLRIFVLTDFAFQYTDSDQVIMWHGLNDFSKGEFHEPRFYGQAYNSMMEALLAVPLYKLGVAPYKALPVITSILAIFPYLLISLLVFLKKSPKLALLILSIPLILPVSYSLITSLPRGFITGIFLSAFACAGIFYPRSNRAIFFSFFLAVLGYSLNANSVLLSAPCLAFLFLENVRNKKFYLYAATGIIAGFILHFFANYFYVTHPYYDTHSYELGFSFKELTGALSNLDLYFNDVTPVFWKTGSFSLIVFIIPAFLFYRKKEYMKTLIVVLLPVFILLTLGVSKVHDGMGTIFYSYSRMYLAVPVALAFVLALLPGITNSRYIYLYLFLPVFFFGYQLNQLDEKIVSSVDPLEYKKVVATETKKVIEACTALKAVCDTHKVELVVIVYHDLYNFYTYAYPALNAYPKTLAPAWERRTWRFFEDENKIYKTILLIDAEKTYADKFEFVEDLPADTSFHLIRKNNIRTMPLLSSLGIWVRDYKEPAP
jgi:hypothetical protein